MKDPAFLFYSGDFLNGVSDLTMDERGQYITLLCAQHIKGELTEKTIRLLVGSVSVDVLDKFSITENGNYVNLRLSLEIEKRQKFSESRRINGKKGGRPLAKSAKTQDESLILPQKNNKKISITESKPNGLAKTNHMENVNINRNTNEIIKGGLGEKNQNVDQLPDVRQTIIPDIFTAAELLETDEAFLEQLAMKQKIDPDQLRHMLTQFDLSKQESEEKFVYDDMTRLKAGFTKWVNSWLYTERRQSKKINGSKPEEIKITREMYYQ